MRQKPTQAVPQALYPPTILLVDDDGQIRGLCRTLLSEGGFTVLEASNGLEAVLLAVERQGAIDLVVTDLAMPQMNGTELGRVLQQIWPGVNVLYMSGSLRETVIDELPADCGFLAKPFAPDELMDAVDRVLGARATRPGSTGSLLNSEGSTDKRDSVLEGLLDCERAGRKSAA